VRAVSAGLQAAIEQGKICRVIAITLPDASVVGLTDHDRPLVIGGTTYEPATTRGGRLFSREGAAVDSQTFDLGWGQALEEALLGGDYDDAALEYGIAGWAMAAPERMVTFKGDLGRLHWNRDGQRVEYQDLMTLLGRTIGRTFGPGCPVNLGSQGAGQCNVDLSTFEVAVTVTSIDGASPLLIFSDSGLSDADAWFDDGEITWATGLNAGRTDVIEAFASNQFTLQLPARYAVAIGDTGTATPGCDKSTGAGGCDKFSNRDNFQGWPFVREQQELGN
jgi:uncharacterized phage protein (TIGR02218 family)